VFMTKNLSYGVVSSIASGRARVYVTKQTPGDSNERR